MTQRTIGDAMCAGGFLKNVDAVIQPVKSAGAARAARSDMGGRPHVTVIRTHTSVAELHMIAGELEPATDDRA